MIAESYIIYIEKIFSMLEVIEEQKVPLIAFSFIGEAKYWWRLKKDLQPISTTWDHFLEAFYQTFFWV